jgi:hypothetical protein
MPREGQDGIVHVDSAYTGDPNLSTDRIFTGAPRNAFFTDQSTGALWVRNRPPATLPAAGGWSELAPGVSIHSVFMLNDCGPFEGFASGAYLEVTPGGTPFPTSWTWWTDTSKAIKIYEMAVTYSGAKITEVIRRAYDVAGALAITFTDTVTYSGPFEVSRVRTWA